MLNGMKFVEGPFPKPVVWKEGIYIRTYGADPEFFAFKDDQPVVPKSILKKEITKTKSVNNVFGDGPVYETEVDVSSDPDWFTDSVYSAFDRVVDYAKYYDKVSVRNVPQVEFSKDYWETVPDFVKEIGCNPDIYLWPEKNGYWISEADPQDLDNVRYAGGHIHIGFVPNNNNLTESDAKAGESCISDFHIHAASVFVALFVSEVYPRILNLERKKFGKLNFTPRFASRYGVPVLCRIKPYGVEIRCTSNWALTDGKARRVLENSLYNIMHGRYTKPKIDFTDVPYGDELTDMVHKFRKEFLK